MIIYVGFEPTSLIDFHVTSYREAEKARQAKQAALIVANEQILQAKEKSASRRAEYEGNVALGKKYQDEAVWAVLCMVAFRLLSCRSCQSHC